MFSQRNLGGCGSPTRPHAREVGKVATGPTAHIFFLKAALIRGTSATRHQTLKTRSTRGSETTQLATVGQVRQRDGAGTPRRVRCRFRSGRCHRLLPEDRILQQEREEDHAMNETTAETASERRCVWNKGKLRSRQDREHRQVSRGGSRRRACDL